MLGRRTGGVARRTHRWKLLVPAAVLALGTFGFTAGAAAQAAPSAGTSASTHRTSAPRTSTVRAAVSALNRHDYRRACALAGRGRAACLALVRTNVAPHLQQVSRPDAAPTGDGYGPSSLQSAYKLPSSTAGSGQTVAVVDAYNDPDAAADLATYRSAWGLPACGSGCFSVVNENGATSPLPTNAAGTGWDLEESLDVDMVSAICPLCHIILAEASSASYADLGTAENSAVSLGAKFVSNSYGGSDSSSDSTYDADYYNHPGVAITASAGDDGYGVEYPAASQYVTAVGGTSLTAASNSRGWTETTWGSSSGGEGSGSGCSAYEAKPSWQAGVACTHRTNNDVSAVADPNTGVAVYDSYTYGGWVEVGGTSASSPIIASTFALAGTPVAGTYPSSYLYQHPWDLFDVTSGSDGSCSPAYLCTAQVGYDAPTGWGTPDGTAAFTDSPHWSSWLNEIGAPSPGVASGSSPTVSSWAANRLDVFVRGADNAIWHAWWDGSAWNYWESRGPAIVSSPAAVSWGSGRIDLFGVGSDGKLYHQYYSGSWSGWTSELGTPPPGIASGSSPAVASWGANHLDVFVRGGDNAVWQTTWNGSSWSGWTSLGGSITGSPAAVSWGPGRIDLFAVGSGGVVYHKYYSGSWSAWLSEIGAPPPGIASGSSPTVSSWGPNRLDVFVRGADNAIWHAWWDGTNWSNIWESRGTAIASSPAAVSWSANRIDLFGIGTDGRVYHQYYG